MKELRRRSLILTSKNEKVRCGVYDGY